MATEAGALPDDALAVVFRALPLRSLAVVRCVCKAWRDVVDARALLLPHLHLLPRTVRGVFINCEEHDHPHHYLARPCSPSTIPRVDGTLGFLPKDHSRSVLDHCNGLLLCGTVEAAELSELCVCNPATCRWTVLPSWWEHAGDKQCHPYAGAYIAFDPAESPQYEVILVPAVPEALPPHGVRRWEEEPWTAAEVQQPALLREEERDAPFCLDWFLSLPDDGTAVGQWEFQQLQRDIDDPCRCMKWRGYMEWPPAPWTLRVFSSRTGRWEDRAFVREGMPAGTVAKMRSDLELPYYGRRWRYAVYHRGSLYVHCRGSFVARFSLSKSKQYQIIQTPANVKEYTKTYLGKLQNGACFGTVHDHQLKIWILNESCGQMDEWVLKYEILVGHCAYGSSGSRQHNGSWTLEENIAIQDTNHAVESLPEENIESQDTNHDVESVSKEGYEWDSDNDDPFTVNTESQEYFKYYEKHINIFGFHPYKEVVFMVQRFQVVAYHLNSTKIQYLGNSNPKYGNNGFWNHMYGSFPYTPCMIGDLLHGDQTGDPSSSQD